MNIKTITFFNNKGGVGKTSLAYHVSWMLRELGNTVLSVDLDPQANLTGMFMNEDKLEEIMEKNESIYSALEPLMKGTGDIKEPQIFTADERLGLLPGDLKLSNVEGEFSDAWPKCLDASNERPFRVTTAFSRVMRKAGAQISANWAIVDMGPNLGAINRSVLIASDYVVFPLGPDLFSYQGLKNVGGVLNKWRENWTERKKKKPEDLDFSLPEGNMTPVGYVMMRHSIRHDRPVKAYEKWINKMPTAYTQYILRTTEQRQKRVLKKTSPKNKLPETAHLLAHLKDYRSLMPMAQDKTKPMFLLKPGDGAIGAHYTAVRACYDDFEALTKNIISAIDKII